MYPHMKIRVQTMLVGDFSWKMLALATTPTCHKLVVLLREHLKGAQTTQDKARSSSILQFTYLSVLMEHVLPVSSSVLFQVKEDKQPENRVCTIFIIHSLKTWIK